MTDLPVELQPSLCLYRSTSSVRKMVEFLEVLGLHRTLRDADGSVYLFGAAGMVAVYHADDNQIPGETQLSFEAADPFALGDHLQQQGLMVKQFENSIGVRDPQGTAIQIHEGYHDAEDLGDEFEPTTTKVMGVRASTDFAADVEFFAHFGFAPEGPADQHWMLLASQDAKGGLGLHTPWPNGEKAWTAPSVLGAPALVHLGFLTADDPQLLVQKLQQAGHQAELLDPRMGEGLSVVDPDGVRLEIHREA